MNGFLKIILKIVLNIGLLNTFLKGKIHKSDVDDSISIC